MNNQQNDIKLKLELSDDELYSELGLAFRRSSFLKDPVEAIFCT